MSGNPVVTAAGLATLRLLTPDAYVQLEKTSSRLAQGLDRILRTHGIRATVARVGSMLSIFFGIDCVHNFDEAMSADHSRFAKFFHGLLTRHVHLPPSGYESWFISLAHNESTIASILAAAEDVVWHQDFAA